MATISVGENRWRMLRKIELAKPQPARWLDFRDWRRSDSRVLDELIVLGLVEAVPGRTDCYRITEKGKEIARFGEIDHRELLVLKKADVTILGGDPVPATLPLPPARRKPGPKPGSRRLAGARF